MARRFVLGLLTGLVVVGGCSPQDTAELKEDAGKLSKSVARAAQNTELNARILATLAGTKGVRAESVRISSKGGHVTVRGTMRDKAEQKLVLDVVKRTRGVEKVTNETKIMPELKAQRITL
ncbi:MAG: BON domain-containing protein [Fimbriimonadaceae bacterium]|nr:BON domain-containing protein [Fimbriimonadaceae bacterium]